jgi:hypothetical protein
VAEKHTPTDDIVYDLVSVQYHALNGAQLYDKFTADADGHEDVRAFFQRCAEEDARRAEECHQLIGRLTGAAPRA